jgi:hypothetical protein
VLGEQAIMHEPLKAALKGAERRAGLGERLQDPGAGEAAAPLHRLEDLAVELVGGANHDPREALLPVVMALELRAKVAEGQGDVMGEVLDELRQIAVVVGVVDDGAPKRQRLLTARVLGEDEQAVRIDAARAKLVVDSGVDRRAHGVVGEQDGEPPVEDSRAQEPVVRDEVVSLHPRVEALHGLGYRHRAAVQLEQPLARAPDELGPQGRGVLVAVAPEVEIGCEGFGRRPITALGVVPHCLGEDGCLADAHHHDSLSGR